MKTPIFTKDFNQTTDYNEFIASIIEEIISRVVIWIIENVDGIDFKSPVLDCYDLDMGYFDINLTSREGKKIVIRISLNNIYLIGININNIWYHFTDSDAELFDKGQSLQIDSSYQSLGDNVDKLYFYYNSVSDSINSLQNINTPLTDDHKKAITTIIISFCEAIRFPSVKETVGKSFIQTTEYQNRLSEFSQYVIWNWKQSSVPIVLNAFRDIKPNINESELRYKVFEQGLIKLNDVSVLKVPPKLWVLIIEQIIKEKGMSNSKKTDDEKKRKAPNTPFTLGLGKRGKRMETRITGQPSEGSTLTWEVNPKRATNWADLDDNSEETLIRVGARSRDPIKGQEIRVRSSLGEPYNSLFCAVEYFKPSSQIPTLILPKDRYLLETHRFNRSPLCQNPNSVSALLELGVNANFDARNLNVEIVRVLLNFMARGCHSGPLQIVILNSSLEELNQKKKSGITSLIAVLMERNVENFGLLVMAGAALKAVTEKKISSLLVPVLLKAGLAGLLDSSVSKVVDYVVRNHLIKEEWTEEAGVDMNRKVIRGFPITAVTRDGHISILQMLLEASSIKDSCEDALIKASPFSQLKAVQLLILSELAGPTSPSHVIVTASSPGFINVGKALLIKV